MHRSTFICGPPKPGSGKPASIRCSFLPAVTCGSASNGIPMARRSPGRSQTILLRSASRRAPNRAIPGKSPLPGLRFRPARHTPGGQDRGLPADRPAASVPSRAPAAQADSRFHRLPARPVGATCHPAGGIRRSGPRRDRQSTAGRPVRQCDRARGRRTGLGRIQAHGRARPAQAADHHVSVRDRIGRGSTRNPGRMSSNWPTPWNLGFMTIAGLSLSGFPMARARPRPIARSPCAAGETVRARSLDGPETAGSTRST